MAHAIGCIGSSIEQRTKMRSPMTKAQRERNNRLVPRRVRNQSRDIGFILISRDGETPKVKAIKAGHAHHYKAAYWYAKVEIVKENGKPKVLRRPK